jgi:hypothetical protein
MWYEVFHSNALESKNKLVSYLRCWQKRGGNRGAGAKHLLFDLAPRRHATFQRIEVVYGELRQIGSATRLVLAMGSLLPCFPGTEPSEPHREGHEPRLPNY